MKGAGEDVDVGIIRIYTLRRPKNRKTEKVCTSMRYKSRSLNKGKGIHVVVVRAAQGRAGTLNRVGSYAASENRYTNVTFPGGHDRKLVGTALL